MYCGANNENILDAGLWMLDEKKNGVSYLSSIKHRFASICRMFPSPTRRFEAELRQFQVIK